MFRKLFSTRGGSAARSAVRAVVVCATAFGLDWSADQVAAVMLATEALLQLGGVLFGTDELPPPPA